MIPNKKKTNKVRLKASTELQTLAQKENFALFVLTGMHAQFAHLRNCPSINTRELTKLDEAIGVIKNHIKQEQAERRSLRKPK